MNEHTQHTHTHTYTRADRTDDGRTRHSPLSQSADAVPDGTTRHSLASLTRSNRSYARRSLNGNSREFSTGSGFSFAFFLHSPFPLPRRFLDFSFLSLSFFFLFVWRNSLWIVSSEFWGPQSLAIGEHRQTSPRREVYELSDTLLWIGLLMDHNETNASTYENVRESWCRQLVCSIQLTSSVINLR